MSKSQHNIESLISDLSDDLECTTRCKHPLVLMSVWFIIAVAFTAAAIHFMGLRADIAIKLGQPFFLLETFLALAITLSAGTASFFLRTPDSRGAGWLTTFPYVLIGVLITWTLIRFITEDASLPDFH